ncbi:disease resistance protein PIK5-NP-like isoform X2 [Aegilops tauschii subsp. strangulata]|uniref:NB-ARC domain-containing protein n=1 Tax=Aegilops tauschii subsp. strangulata TaxID=200361 RepID=A0A453E2E5_AEGTS|nr:disease resistance protein Pikm1-TS-like isoform X2 [Aegilops tauschii subsp. strangulata]
MKEGPVESAATGSLGPVIAKLAALLGSEYKLRWRTRRDVKFIKSKFKSMHSLLWATWEREVPDAASKESKMAALLLADDMDDAVDDFILAMEPSRRSKRLIQTKIEASAFEDFKRRASDVSGRWKKTAHPICTLFPRNTAILSPRKPTPRAHPFVRKNASMLVPMDEPINELVKFLTGEDAESTLSQPQLKMASILGMAGMGKTTLADQVYEKIENKFDARAFVSVTQGGNIKDVLAGILEQVAAENTTAPPAGTEAESEEHILIDQISDFFKDKRYLVIIDDIWHWEEWETIRKSLPENNLGSRVVTTTRMNAVARMWRDDCDALLHKMHPQFDRQGRWVYKISGTQDVCTKIISRNATKMVGKGFDRKHPVVGMCSGMPLAVVCMLSAVAKEREKQAEQGVDAKTRDVQDMVEKQVRRHGIQNTPGFEPLVESLQLGYNDLPHHMLKSCLLYCSLYAEQHDFARDETVSRWLAEGFVHKEEAGDYYAELFSRGFIFEIAYESENMVMFGYRMHPMMRNFLKWKSHEDNFIITHSSSDIQSSPIRRLCIDDWAGSDPSSGTDWSHIRSLVVFKDAERVPYKQLARLRVLDVQKNHALDNHHLKDMCGLPRVRHLLGELGPRITEIPSEIGKLQRLETLEVRNTCSTELPVEIGRLKQLRTLLVPGNELKVLPREIGRLQQLETLDMSRNEGLVELPSEIGCLQQLRNLGADNTGITKMPKEIGKLQQLKNLNMSKTMMTVLPKEIMKLQNLEKLDLTGTQVEKIPWKTGGLKELKSLALDRGMGALPLDVCQLSELVTLPECIRQARFLSWIAEENLFFQISDMACEGGLVVGANQMRIPPWIKDHFNDLALLDIKVCKLEEEDLEILREMPTLRELSLRFQVVPKEPVVISAKGFASLWCFCVDSRVPRVTFQEGAMPRLGVLKFQIQSYGGPPNKDPLGITHLVNLGFVQIGCNEEWYRADSPCIMATVDEAREHPNNISIKINGINVAGQDESSSEDEEEWSVGTDDAGENSSSETARR